ncbi:uncharacterized protein LOC110990907 isoform X1 [Acanthaster planci]|uniref:Uncharacterized protein LOC110990907 isoform X1 n=1 Tax=Acanthaster planci TaxID=133434 RepID=A0A8B8A2T8_ACAPL|nr:uncharacterized protein LOC110990907 isoform X1 [Acanthaster planci]XP_022111683.1 uncharacterized protein LOC110990907 isoform X1 [Acanthaster planci]
MAPIGNVTSADDLSPSYSATMAPYSVTSAQYEPTLLAPTSAGFGLSEDVKWLILAVISALGVVVGIVGLIKSWKWCRSKRERSQSRQQQCELVPLTDTAEWSTSDVQSQAAAKCKDALKEHYRTTGGASLQSGQPSGDMSENQPSTSQQSTTQGAVSHSQTPGNGN